MGFIDNRRNLLIYFEHFIYCNVLGVLQAVVKLITQLETQRDEIKLKKVGDMKLNGSANIDWLRPTFLLSTDLFIFKGQLGIDYISKLIENYKLWF